MKYQRMLSLILAAALLLGSAVPVGNTGGILARVSAKEMAAESARITFSCENGKILDASASNDITDGITANAGENFTFTVVPNDGYKVNSVMCGDSSVEADANGMYTVNVSADLHITVTCSEKEAPVFTAAALPAGPAREKSFQIEISASDASITTKAYSRSTRFDTVVDLGSAIVTGDAFQIGTDTVITENGTYYLYIVDEDGRMTVGTVEVADIDRTAPAAATVQRLKKGWLDSVGYSITVPAPEDTAMITLTVSDGEETEVVPNEDGSYGFVAAVSGEYQIRVYDAVGNVAVTTVSEEQVDSTAPSVSASRSAEGWASEVAYTITASDVGSGVKMLYITVGESTTTIFYDSEDTYIYSVKSNQTAYIKAVDYVGNEYTLELAENKIDTDAPQISEPVRSSDSWTSAATYTFTVTDADSGVASVVLTTSTGEKELTPDENGAYSFTLTENTTFQIKATDNLGFTAETEGEESKIDTEAPLEPDIKRVPTGWSQSAQYTFTPTDDLSGIASVTVTLGSNTVAVTNTDGTYSFTATACGTYNVTILDTAGNKTICSITEGQVDTTLPVISAHRNTSGWSTSAEYSYTVTDEHSGVRNITVTINGTTQSITPDSTGNYMLTLTNNDTVEIRVSDIAGNEAVSTFTEQNIDLQAPVITALSRSSDSWAANAIYTFRVSDPLSGVKEVTLTANTGETTILTPDENGLYSFTLTDNTAFSLSATDKLGNSTSADGEEVLIDLTAPVLTDVTRVTTGWAPAVNYTFRTEDVSSGIASVTVTNGDLSVTVTNQGSLYSFTLTENGDYTITVKDTVGNYTTHIVTETNADTDAPVISQPVRSAEGWQTSASYTFTVTDDLSGIQKIIIVKNDVESQVSVSANGSYTVTVAENQTIIIRAYDTAGNETRIQFSEDLIDTTKPVISGLIRSSESWETEVSYSFLASDTQSGIAKVMLTVGSGSLSELSANADGSYSFTIAENVSFEILAIDNLGYEETLTGEETKIDLVKPVISDVIRLEAGWSQQANYTFHASDSASGIAKVSVTGSDGDIRVSNNEDIYSFILTKNGSYTITVEDAVGNMASYTVSENQADTVAPVISQPVRTAEGWQTSSTYNFTVTDDLAGIQKIIVKIGEAEYELPVSTDGKYTVTLTANCSVQIRAKDNAGNEQTFSFEESRIDTTNPVISGLTRDSNAWETEVSYNFLASDIQSGIAKVLLTVGSGSPVELTANADGSYSFMIAENVVFEIRAFDELGHEAILTGEETRIDLTGPIIEAVERKQAAWTQAATYSFKATDAQSGISSVSVMGSQEEVAVILSKGLYRFELAQNGTYTICVTDNVGHVSTYLVEETQTDTSAPVISDICRETDGWSHTVPYSFNVSDDLSGVVSVSIEAADVVLDLIPDGSGKCQFVLHMNQTVIITVKDAAGNTVTQSITESQADANKPSITDLIRNTSDWNTFASYSFRTTDDLSGLAKVVVSFDNGQEQELTAAEDGLYTFIIDHNRSFQIIVTDIAGNVASLEGQETKVDTTDPTITGIVRESDMWEYATSYTIHASDGLSGILDVKVTDANGTTVDVLANTDGIYTFPADKNISYTVTVTDYAGNTVSQTVTEDHIDQTPPVISDVQRERSTWSQNSYYTFQVSDVASGVAKVRVLNGDLEIDYTVTDGVYRFLAKNNGYYTVEVADTVGNTSGVVFRESMIDLQVPVISKIEAQTQWDAEKNTVVILAEDESELSGVRIWDASGKEFSVTEQDDGSFVAVVDKNGNYTAEAKDTAGNLSVVLFKVWHIDTECPNAPTLTSSGEEKWVNTDVTITADALDSQSGVVSYWYSDKDIPFDPATWTKTDFADGIGSITFTQEQDTVYYFVSQDLVGRVSEKTSIRVAIDKTAPSDFELVYLETEDSGYLRTVNGRKIYKDKITFFMKASDDASGVVAYEFYPQLPQVVYPESNCDGNEKGVIRTILLADTYAHVWFRVYDEAGNCSEYYTLTENGEPVDVILENTPEMGKETASAPTLQAMAGDTEYDGQWTNKDITIAVSGSGAISGIEYYEYKILPSGETPTGWTKVPETEDGFALTLTKNENSRVLFRAVTYAGNASKEADIQVYIQKTSPKPVQFQKDTPSGTNDWYTKIPGYIVAYPDQDPLQAGASYEFFYSLNGGDFISSGDKEPVITGDGVWRIYAVSTDAAGNTAASGVAVFKVDSKTPDKLTVTLNGTQDILQLTSGAVSYDKVNISNTIANNDFSIFLNATATIQVQADGGDSGMAAVYYQISADNTCLLDSGWTLLENGTLTVRPNSKNCLFFKAVDNAGNVTFFSATSIILDDLAPGGTEPSAAISIEPATNNLSAHGYYFDDVAFNIHVEEPVTDTVFSGIQSIRFRVLADGNVTQEGSLPLDGSHLTMQEGRVLAWDGLLIVQAELNDSNNVVVELTALDKAGNARVSVSTPVRIDITDPQIRAEYDQNIPAEVRNDITYFTGSRTLTVTVTEKNFVAAESFVRIVDNDTGTAVDYKWISNGLDHTAILNIRADGHYTVSAIVTDAAGNTNTTILFDEGTVAATSFVIDNTRPQITVSYDNNTSSDQYFDTPRTATISVMERNFDPADFNAQFLIAAPNGQTIALPVTGWTSNGNTHTAQVSMTRDGIYTVMTSCTDIPGNNSVNTVYLGSFAQNWILDQTIAAPEVSGVADGHAYADAVIPVIIAEDINMQDLKIKLYRTRMGEIKKDITEEFLESISGPESTDTGRTWTLDIFPEEESYDGIYTLEALVTDKAGNEALAVIIFSVNRFGSTYRYDEALMAVNGKVIYSLDKDLTITEINPTMLQEGSVIIQITRDGTPIANPIYTVAPAADGTENPAEHGWYEYQYIIAPENFREDGIYTVILSTKDAAGNVPENTGEDQKIRFAIDTTAPKLTSVIGLEESIVKADSLTVQFKAMDNIGLHSIQVYLNGTLEKHWVDLKSYELEEIYTIPEGLEQHIRIVITDKAGNILDTDAEDFAPGFAWQDVTVSSNAWLRFYANKAVFFGTIAGAAAGTTILLWFLLGKKRKKEQEGS